MAEEVIQAAVSEANSTAQQLQREIQAREKVQATLRELQENQSRLTQQVEWQADTAALLDTIQQECNAVFDRRKPSTTTPVVDFDHMMTTSKITADSADMGKTASAHALLPHEVDKALEETEAIVRSLMGGDITL